MISPLIALMEDQSTRLAAQGFRAERIHSGRSRAESRQACIDYLAGNLDFLFIAPERLRVPGFPEMLARRTPALIAVDEAHCISQWGHDFRPDYRMLGQRLPALRPAPIIALTATATPTVQDDIVAQLGLRDAGRFIHGFRRTNIAIEVIERNPGERAAAIRELLSDRARRPAIVYAATRKSAEELASALGPRLAAAYHAGMSNEDRDRVQAAFLNGEREVIVATTAFGMGIDKADVRTILHAALPGSLEGYYQEIGRAGRDGAPARAVLFHAYVDRKTHEFFHERDYPDPLELEKIYKKLPKTPTDRAALNKKRSRAGREAFERALEKLVIHGGAVETGEELARGASTWQAGYAAQREHKQAQLLGMARFAEGHGCRMVRLVRHFGDQEDSGEPCGICDACAPARCIAQEYRAPSASEQRHVSRLLAALAQADGQATGRLHRETFPNGDVRSPLVRAPARRPGRSRPRDPRGGDVPQARQAHPVRARDADGGRPGPRHDRGRADAAEGDAGEEGQSDEQAAVESSGRHRQAQVDEAYEHQAREHGPAQAGAGPRQRVTRRQLAQRPDRTDSSLRDCTQRAPARIARDAASARAAA
ncbi:RecQ family ATP-dependent DNA helicase [Nannocystis pusilla]|uniref:RecQ family ATP-dependent DNA helicase n=1 Tax=Nannocystis pusilla TaxID=889268 RepID=UPI003DA44B9D